VALYTGNNTSLSVTGLEFSPDFVWLKARSEARSNFLFDVIRGTGEWLKSDGTDAETTDVNTLTSFDTNGFSLGSSSKTNNNTITYAGWCWDAGSSTVTNTDGSLTSSVRANPTAGFSIATYTGNAVSGATFGHGLGVAPEMVIIKRRNDTRQWAVGHQYADPTWNLNLILNGTNGTIGQACWNATAPTSSVVTLGTTVNVNGLGDTYVAYCFAPVEGYSAFGSYIGNGSTDGPFVYTGFRPRYVLIKRTDTTEHWVIQDTARSTKNIATEYLLANTSGAEGNSDILDILSNGFKQRNTFASNNASGGTYIYAAFAENPISIARAR